MEIHLLSLDIEGNEEKVLRAIDFKKIFVHTICLEDNYNEKKLDGFLKQYGFVLIKHCGFDKIFINQKSKFLPRDFFILRIKASLINIFYTRKLQKLFREKINQYPKLKKNIKKILNI